MSTGNASTACTNFGPGSTTGLSKQNLTTAQNQEGEPTDGPSGENDSLFAKSELLAAGDGVPTGDEFEAGYNWLLRRQLYRKLQENPDLAATDPVVQHFFDASHENSLGYLDAIAVGQADPVPFDADTWQKLNDQTEISEAIAVEMAAIETQLQNADLKTEEEEALYSELSALNAAVEAAAVEIDHLQAPYATLREEAFERLATENEAVPAEAAWESLEKQVNALYLGKIRLGQWLTGEDRDFLFKTASMCPEEGGVAVYQARSLWAMLTGHAVQGHDCIGAQMREAADRDEVRGSSEIRLSVLPNPTSGEVLLSLSSSDKSPATEFEYRIMGLIGNVVRTGNFPSESTTLRLDLGALPTGLYTCQIIGNNQVKANAKISVIATH